MMHPSLRSLALTRTPIDAAALARSVGDPSAGAIVVFEGVTREVELLRFEAYEPMALRRMQAHAEDAIERYALAGVAIAHRLGDVPLGEASIVIAVAAGHRPEGFDGCRFLIDAIKSDVPIWKQEITGAGASWGRSETDLASVEASATRGARST